MQAKASHFVFFVAASVWVMAALCTDPYYRWAFLIASAIYFVFALLFRYNGM